MVGPDNLSPHVVIGESEPLPPQTQPERSFFVNITLQTSRFALGIAAGTPATSRN
jgi:hypothetical protein